MKFLMLSFVIVSTIFGCVATGNAPYLTGNSERATVDKKNSFIELNNGDIVEGEISGSRDRATSWALVGGKWDAVVGGKKYEYSNFVAIQEKEKYFRKYNNRFTERIVHGKINVYRQSFENSSFNTSNANGGTSFSTIQHYQFYLQKGDREKLVYFDLKTLKSMIKDFQPALSLMDDYNKLSKKQKRKDGDYFLDHVIAKYNEQ